MHGGLGKEWKRHMKEYRKYAEEMLEFIDKSPTGFHAVANLAAALEEQGLRRLKESQAWELAAGEGCYVTRNDSSLIAFRLPAKDRAAGFHIAASHADSPTFKVKEAPEMPAENAYVKLNTEKYGGMILSSKAVNDKYNFNKAIFPGTQGGPLMHVIAAKAVCFREALTDAFKQYQKNIIDNAQALCRGLMDRGVRIVSGGTDNHLMLVDLTNFGITGKAAEKLLDAAHITCNKNTIPNDPQSPFVTSGIRLGTPAVTSRGMNTEDMDKIAEAIALVIKGGEESIPQARAIVQTLTFKYPL